MTADNETTTTQGGKPEQAAPLDSWEMACAILTGIRKAAAKAEEERETAVAASDGRPSAPGTTKPRLIRDLLQDAEARLAHDMGQVARLNGLSLPRKGG